MDKEKIRLVNNYINKINEIKVNITRAEEALHNLVRSGMEKSFIESSKLKNKEKIERYNQEIFDLDSEITLIKQGHKDTEIQEQIEKNKKENSLLFQKNKVENAKNKADYILKSKESFQKIRKYTYEMNTDNGGKYKEKEWDRSLYHYYKALDRVPEYILKNLRDMPNNKGYRFMGVDFFGKLPAKTGEHYMLFEKLKDNILLIHEFFPNRTKVTKKYPNGKKEIIDDKITPSLLSNQANFSLKQTKKKI
jgi:hypothetical protein